jgi:predicted ArsR family transcriptional regulator
MQRRLGQSKSQTLRQLGKTNQKILMLLCRGSKTVAELANELGVTGNAVRAQLQRLARDGLLRQAGSRRGVRRPHVEYDLTDEGRDLFPKAYEPALKTLINVLDARLPQPTARDFLRETARQLLSQQMRSGKSGEPQRLSQIIRRLTGDGAGITLSKEKGKTALRSCSCPLASITADHPQVCGVLATVLGELLKCNVQECCERGAVPQCAFHIARTE